MSTHKRQLSYVKLGRRGFVRSAAGAVVLALSSLSSLSHAQSDERVAQGSIKSIDVPCCQCIDGRATTINLDTGSAPWTAAAGNNPQTATNPAQLVTAMPSAWAVSAPAKWVNSGTTTVGFHSYRLVIRVPKCIIPMTISLDGKAWGDDVLQMKLDGQPIGASSNPNLPAHSLLGGTSPSIPYAAGTYGGYGQATNLTLNPVGLTPGMHVLTAVVENAMGPAGFLFNGKLTIRCAGGRLDHPND